MKRFLTFFLLFLLISGFTVHAQEVEKPQKLYAKAAVLMDGDSGRVLFDKNGEVVLANASTTKIITCIIALERGHMEDTVTVSEYAASQPKVHLGMRQGEQFILRDLLYSLMLESHNDSAVAIAEHIAGSAKKFALLMNEKAKEIGCNNTYFITPNGLDEVDENGSHSTTAADLAKMMKYCVMESKKRDEFIEITGTSSYSFSSTENERTFSCTNRNSFLNMMEGAFSGKTGFTGKAGYCYVGALKRDNRTFIVALLACGWPNNKNYKWSDTKTLMEYGIENYCYQMLDEKIELPIVSVENGIPLSERIFDQAYVKLEIDMEEDCQMLLRQDEIPEVIIECKEQLDAPLKKGDKVGTVSFLLNGNVVKRMKVVAKEDIKERTISWVFERILKLYLAQ